MTNTFDLGSLSPDDSKKMQQIVDDGMRQLQEIDDLRSSLRDAVKGLAEEFGVKPKLLMMAVRSAYKNDITTKREEMDAVEGILQATGNA